MLARGPVTAQQPNLSSTNDDDTIGDTADGDDDDDDDDACDESSNFVYASSARMHQPQEPPGISVTPRETNTRVALKPTIRSPSITHFQQPHIPLEIPQSTGAFFDWSRTNTPGHVQTYPELPTPASDCPSRFYPSEVSTSAIANSQPLWHTRSSMEEHCFRDPEPFDIGFFDMPGSSDEPKNNRHIENNGGNTPMESSKKGSVTLTLCQVDPDVAQQIMGSVLKHSEGLKISVHCE